MLAAAASKRKLIANRRRQKTEVLNRIVIENGVVIHRETLINPREEKTKERQRQEAVQNLIDLKRIAAEISDYSVTENLSRNRTLNELEEHSHYSFPASTKTSQLNDNNGFHEETKKEKSDILIFENLNENSKEKSIIKPKENQNLSHLNLSLNLSQNLSMDSERHSEMRLDDSDDNNNFNSQDHTLNKRSYEMNFNRRKPVKLDSIDKNQLSSLNNNEKNNNSNSQDLRRNFTSSMDTDSKKIIRWHLWWEKPESYLKVPSYNLPNKQVPSKIGSLEKINHRPGGGLVQVINEKPNWNRRARIDHVAKDYKPGVNKSHSPGGGDIEIFDEPLKKPKIKPKIDTGLVFEEVIVPIDYVVTPRSQTTMSISHISSSMGKHSSKLEPITENSQNKSEDLKKKTNL